MVKAVNISIWVGKCLFTKAVVVGWFGLVHCRNRAQHCGSLQCIFSCCLGWWHLDDVVVCSCQHGNNSDLTVSCLRPSDTSGTGMWFCWAVSLHTNDYSVGKVMWCSWSTLWSIGIPHVVGYSIRISVGVCSCSVHCNEFAPIHL